MPTTTCEEDTPSHGGHALQPVVAESMTLVSATERRLAVEHWLLSTHPAPGHPRIRLEWQEHGVAMLRLGALFSAVRLPGDLVLAASDCPGEAAEVDAFLDEALNGGPVICDPRGRRYYALTPPGLPDSWQQAADDWRALGVDLLGCATYLGVPRPDAVELDIQAYGPYWSVPISSVARLCAPLDLARLIAVGERRMSEEVEA
ncbi:hypothetical protein ABZT04_03260 [Streptomyces sp. NPDC005492]|uniref:hypothetical protein n=1 Tax=Streptomyces sp. NPDC005492 TaxID=3156883 RepID=UPI0033BC88D0